MTPRDVVVSHKEPQIQLIKVGYDKLKKKEETFLFLDAVLLLGRLALESTSLRVLLKGALSLWNVPVRTCLSL